MQKEAPYIGHMGTDLAYLRASEYNAEKFVSLLKKKTNTNLTWRKDLELIVIVNPGPESDNKRVIQAICAHRKSLEGSLVHTKPSI